MRENIHIDQLRSLIRLDPKSGTLFWKRREDDVNGWNKRFAGKEALTSNHGTGYKAGTILGKSYFAHRVAFALANGKWPENDVDHINGRRSDNRPDNLREATRAQNLRNTRVRSKNRSGYKGVSWHAIGKKWQASIRINGKSTALGLFERIEDAAAAYDKAAIAAYGEFAATNQTIEMAPAQPTKAAEPVETEAAE